MASPLYIDCDNGVGWFGAKGTSLLGVTSYLNTATITFQLYDLDEVAVSAVSGSLTYVTDSNGVYRGVITSTSTSGLEEGTDYKLRFTLVSGSYDDQRELLCTAQRRRES